MLDVCDATKIEQLWSRTALKAALNVAEEEFFGYSGPMPDRGENQRAYERFYLRRKAVLKRHSDSYGVYLQDCSRMGVGFLSPVQLFPCERVQVCMDNRRIYELEVRRCRRVGKNSYECGTVFILDK